MLPQLVEPGLRRRRSLLQFAPPVGIEPLSSMEAPDLQWRVKPQHWRDLRRRPPCDHRHAGLQSRAPLTLNPLEQLTHSSPWPRREAIHPETRQRPVVVQQQHRARSRRKAVKESVQFFRRC